MKLFDLTGRKAIVTGATRGLGRGMAEGLMEAGCEVVVVGSSASALSVAEEFRSKGFACHGLAVDLSEREQRRAGFAQAVELLGGHLDILVNGAGIQRRHFCEEFPIEDWDAVLEVNLTAAFDLCQMAGQQFIRQNSKGKIINIASIHAFVSRLGYNTNAYCAAKGGLLMLTKSLAQEWAKYNITVNGIAPGYFPSELTGAYIDAPAFKKVCEDYSPMGRPGITGEMDGLCIYLASDASSFTTGQMIAVDGGWLTI